jgi:arsenite methyltransferase
MKYDIRQYQNMINNNRADMLNRKASNPKAKPEQVIESLKLHPNQIIADIGAGGGYYALRFAKIVGNQGKVYAIDSNPEFLLMINEQSKENGLNNITTVPAADVKSVLKPAELDIIFVRNTYHHLESRVNYFSEIKPFLKPSGRIAIIEYKKAGSIFSFHRIFGHFVKPDIINNEMQQAGYEVAELLNFLKEQSFTIFNPK